MLRWKSQTLPEVKHYCTTFPHTPAPYVYVEERQLLYALLIVEQTNCLFWHFQRKSAGSDETPKLQMFNILSQPDLCSIWHQFEVSRSPQASLKTPGKILVLKLARSTWYI